MRTGSDTIGEVARRPWELQQEMREDIYLSTPYCAGTSFFYSPVILSIVVHIVVVVLYMYRVYYCVSRSLLDRDTVTGQDRCSSMIALVTTSSERTAPCWRASGRRRRNKKLAPCLFRDMEL